MNSSIISPVSDSIVVWSSGTLTHSRSLGGEKKDYNKEKERRHCQLLFWPNQRGRGSILCRVEVVWHLCGPSPPTTSTPLPLCSASVALQNRTGIVKTHMLLFSACDHALSSPAFAHNRTLRLKSTIVYLCIIVSITNVAKQQAVLLLQSACNCNKHFGIHISAAQMMQRGRIGWNMTRAT